MIVGRCPGLMKVGRGPVGLCVACVETVVSRRTTVLLNKTDEDTEIAGDHLNGDCCVACVCTDTPPQRISLFD